MGRDQRLYLQVGRQTARARVLPRDGALHGLQWTRANGWLLSRRKHNNVQYDAIIIVAEEALFSWGDCTDGHIYLYNRESLADTKGMGALLIDGRQTNSPFWTRNPEQCETAADPIKYVLWSMFVAGTMRCGYKYIQCIYILYWNTVSRFHVGRRGVPRRQRLFGRGWYTFTGALTKKECSARAVGRQHIQPFCPPLSVGTCHYRTWTVFPQEEQITIARAIPSILFILL